MGTYSEPFEVQVGKVISGNISSSEASDTVASTLCPLFSASLQCYPGVASWLKWLLPSPLRVLRISWRGANRFELTLLFLESRIGGIALQSHHSKNDPTTLPGTNNDSALIGSTRSLR